MGQFYLARPKLTFQAAERKRLVQASNPFAAAVQASLEQRALGQELCDAGHYLDGSWHLVAAELNRLRSKQLVASPTPKP